MEPASTCNSVRRLLLPVEVWLATIPIHTEHAARPS